MKSAFSVSFTTESQSSTSSMVSGSRGADLRAAPDQKGLAARLKADETTEWKHIHAREGHRAMACTTFAREREEGEGDATAFWLLHDAAGHFSERHYRAWIAGVERESGGATMSKPE